MIDPVAEGTSVGTQWGAVKTALPSGWRIASLDNTSEGWVATAVDDKDADHVHSAPQPDPAAALDDLSKRLV